ncbi:MAG: hypothetical protein P1U42_12360 [Phycisphaerales bacterium]|nr:hypothetical protein [Phycisphaerales bacterium]
MKKRLLITLVILFVALPLIAIVLRSMGYLYLPPNVKSDSYDTRYTARLFQRFGLVDRNYRITLRDSKSGRLIAEYNTPDEGPMDNAVKFVWNDDSSAVILVAKDFYHESTTRECQSAAYLLIDTASAMMWTDAAQDNQGTPKLTEAILQQYQFCGDD